MLKKCSNKIEQKRNLCYEDVAKSDKSVKFYAGILSHSYLLMLFDIHSAEVRKLKYCDKNKNKKVCYEHNEKLKKPEPKRTLVLMQELIILTLVKLRLGPTGISVFLFQKHKLVVL